MLKGKLTYSMAAGALVIFVGQALGIEIAEAEAASVVGALAAIVAMYGRWRATRKAA